MSTDAPALPSPTQVREHGMKSLGRYWGNYSDSVERLPIVRLKTSPKIEGPLRLVPIQLPSWASTCGVNGTILIPSELYPVDCNADEAWSKVDWWLAIFLLLEAWHERVWEYQNGPIHSYSFRLIGWDERAWKFAWVNRTGLFLRKWAIRRSNGQITEELMSLPSLRLFVTHDVDAVSKTIAIRLKQASFNLLNFARNIARGDLRKARGSFCSVLKFLLSFDNWWTFDQLLEEEAKHDIHATYHFFSRYHSKSLKRWIFDPGYDVADSKIISLMKKIAQSGHTIGLHPSFEDWQNAGAIEAQRQKLEAVLGEQVVECRQHWLRFSWRSTWAAQETAGIRLDSTLMFNDRPGFRNSSALEWSPWNQGDNVAMRIRARPTMFMDSHFFDYQQLAKDQRRVAIANLVGECAAVAGEGALLWHPHTLSNDYGWANGYWDTLTVLEELRES